MRQNYKHYQDDEKKRLIMECRKSGLSVINGAPKTTSTAVLFTAG